jgi:arsenate reductase
MIVVNGLRACDACRKALRALRDAGREVQLRDLREDPPSIAEVAAWREALGEGLLNTRSTTWRGLSDADRAGDPVALMVAFPALVKRPVIADGDALHLGWTEATRRALDV